MNRRIAIAVALTVSAVALTGCKPLSEQGGGGTAPTSTTVAAKITLPEVKGQNGEIVQDKLRKLGLKHVTLGSMDPSAKVVLAPANWTVIGIEPAAGTVVAADDDVVVKVTKHP